MYSTRKPRRAGAQSRPVSGLAQHDNDNVDQRRRRRHYYILKDYVYMRSYEEKKSAHTNKFQRLTKKPRALTHTHTHRASSATIITICNLYIPCSFVRAHTQSAYRGRGRERSVCAFPFCPFRVICWWLGWWWCCRCCAGALSTPGVMHIIYTNIACGMQCERGPDE